MNNKKKFGFVPLSIYEKLNDENYSIRAQGILELTHLTKDLANIEDFSDFFCSFVEFLCTLLDDIMLDISFLTFSLFSHLLKYHCSLFNNCIRILVDKLVLKIGDPKLVIKKEAMSVLCKSIEKAIGPRELVGYLEKKLGHSGHWHVVEEVICFITYVLLKYPKENYNYNSLVNTMMDNLKDVRDRVRFVSMECIVVIYKNIGGDRILEMLETQKVINPKQYGKLLARLKIEKVPKIGTIEGTVDYQIIKVRSRPRNSFGGRHTERPKLQKKFLTNYTGRYSAGRSGGISFRSHSAPNHGSKGEPGRVGTITKEIKFYKRRNAKSRYFKENSFRNKMKKYQRESYNWEEEEPPEIGPPENEDKPKWLTEMENKSNQRRKNERIVTKMSRLNKKRGSGELKLGSKEYVEDDFVSIVSKKTKINIKEKDQKISGSGFEVLNYYSKSRDRSKSDRYGRKISNKKSYHEKESSLDADEENTEEEGEEEKENNIITKDNSMRDSGGGSSYKDLTAPVNIKNAGDLKPCQEPEREFRTAISGLTSEDWTLQFHGLTTVRSILKYHEDVLVKYGIFEIVSLVCKHVHNLRSQLAKQSILTVGELMQKFGNRIREKGLKKVYPTLVKRTSIANNFLSKEAEKTLIIMVKSCNIQKSLHIIVELIHSLNNPKQRRVSAMLLNECLLVLRLKILNMRESRSIFFKSLMKILSDRSSDVRKWGQITAYNFERMFGNDKEKLEQVLIKLRMSQSEIRDFHENAKKGKEKRESLSSSTSVQQDIDFASRMKRKSSGFSYRTGKLASRRNYYSKKKNEEKYTSLKDTLTTKHLQ